MLSKILGLYKFKMLYLKTMYFHLSVNEPFSTQIWWIFYENMKKLMELLQISNTLNSIEDSNDMSL